MNNHVIQLRPAAGRGAQPGAAPVGQARPAWRAPDIEIGDWDLLFRAAIERLAALAEVQVNEAPVPHPHDLSGSTRGVMLACVEAFTQLHATAALELERRRRATPSPDPG